MFTEGSRVVYAGDDLTIGQGAMGKVLVVSGPSVHVQWIDGVRQGQVDLIDSYDLSAPDPSTSVAQVVASQFDQSLEMENTASMMVREAMDSYGEDGVISTLAEAGHLSVLEPYATEALEHLLSHMRADPMLGEMLSALDDYEQHTVLSRLAATLLEPEGEAS